MQYPTALGYVLSAIAVVLYGTVAVFLARREVSPSARSAQRGFVLWWAGLAFLGVYGLVVNDDYGIALADLGLTTYLVVLYALILGVYAILAGLMYYLLYLYTGRRESLAFTIVYWVAMVGVLVWILHGFGGVCMVPDDPGCVPPSNWEEGDGRALGSFEPRPDWIGTAWGLGLVVPPLISAIMYFLLFFRVQEPTARYRVLLISGGIILWFAFSTANSLAGVSGADGGEWGRLVSRVLGLLAATLVLLAYFPPKFVRARYGVRSLTDQRT